MRNAHLSISLPKEKKNKIEDIKKKWDVSARFYIAHRIMAYAEGLIEPNFEKPSRPLPYNMDFKISPNMKEYIEVRAKELGVSKSALIRALI